MNGLNEVHYENFDYNSKDTVFRFTELAKTFENQSHHKDYQVGCITFGIDDQGQTFYIPTVNAIPDIILEKLGNIDSIGDGHPTVHAEMQGLYLLPEFERVSIITSRPECPTCLQGISELKRFAAPHKHVDGVYFDGRSLSANGDMSQRTIANWNISRNMLERVADRGYLPISIVKPSKKIIRKHNEGKHTPGTTKHDDDAIVFETAETAQSLNDFDFATLMQEAGEIAKTSQIPGNEEAVIAIGRKESDNSWVKIGACATVPPGFNEQDIPLLASYKKERKRSHAFGLSSAKRVMMAAIAEHVSFTEGALISTHKLPISGMQINAVGYGLRRFVTPSMPLDIQNNPDHLALHEMSDAGIIEHLQI